MQISFYPDTFWCSVCFYQNRQCRPYPVSLPFGKTKQKVTKSAARRPSYQSLCIRVKIYQCVKIALIAGEAGCGEQTFQSQPCRRFEAWMSRAINLEASLRKCRTDEQAGLMRL